MSTLITCNFCKKSNVHKEKLKTYSDKCPAKGLSNQTTFRQFWAGETVPLTCVAASTNVLVLLESSFMLPVSHRFILILFVLILYCDFLTNSVCIPLILLSFWLICLYMFPLHFCTVSYIMNPFLPLQSWHILHSLRSSYFVIQVLIGIDIKYNC